MAKKAQLMAFVFAILFGVILILGTIWFVLSLAEKYTEMISTYNLENHMLAYRLFYSKNSFFYKDKITGRIFSNIIDIEKFNEQVVADLLGDKIKPDVGISIILEYNNAKKEIALNKETYSYALTRKDIYDISKFKRIIEVKENLQNYPGLLTVEISFKK